MNDPANHSPDQNVSGKLRLLVVALAVGRKGSKPLAMMTPCPSAADLAACHGTDRTLNPEGCIDVDDPHADDRDGGQRMDKNSNTALRDCHHLREVFFPD